MQEFGRFKTGLLLCKISVRIPQKGNIIGILFFDLT